VKLAFAELQGPPNRSKAVPPGGFSAIDKLFRPPPLGPVTLTLLRVTEMAVTVPERPLTETVEFAETP
jgi:hypothetical protein